MKKRIFLAIIVVLVLCVSALAASPPNPQGLTLTEVASNDRIHIAVTVAPLTEAQLDGFGGEVLMLRLQAAWAFDEPTDFSSAEMLELTDNAANLLVVPISGGLRAHDLYVRVRYVATTAQDDELVEVYSEWVVGVIEQGPPPSDAEQPDTPNVPDTPDPPDPGDTVYSWQSGGWAEAEVRAAVAAGVMTDRLSSADLTRNVSRLEFVEICMKLYTCMTGIVPEQPMADPFTDCSEIIVRQAYELGITNGVEGSPSDGTLLFGTHRAITRQDAATMLTRVYKKAVMVGWSLAVNGQYDLNYSMPALFHDDRYIAPYAYANVYYLASHGVIKGEISGGNTSFNPYGMMSREQALIVAARMMSNLMY